MVNFGRVTARASVNFLEVWVDFSRSATIFASLPPRSFTGRGRELRAARMSAPKPVRPAGQHPLAEREGTFSSSLHRPPPDRRQKSEREGSLLAVSVVNLPHRQERCFQGLAIWDEVSERTSKWRSTVRKGPVSFLQSF